MEVVIEGQRNGDRVRYSYYLLDKYDEQTETTSMARTTGYTCTIVARQVLKGLFNREGICPPEFVGSTAGCYNDLLDEYGKRNIELSETKEIVR